MKTTKTKEIYPVQEPTPCYDKNGTQIGWFNPRFPCTAIMVFAWSKTAKEWCVLGSVRGEGAESFKGLMNCPCGYMATDLNRAENAVKELSEECGIEIDPSELEEYYTDDNPASYQQHITTFFGCELHNVNADDVKFSHDGNEIDADGNLEVGEIGFIPLSEIGRFKWAFDHDKILSSYAMHRGYDFWTDWKAFKNKIKHFFNF